MASYVFGPVPSRRLGRSLGVDLIPLKICSYDCIYCQLSATTHKTVEVKEWVPVDAVLKQVEDRLSTRPDYITLSGSGEPTLHAHLGTIIAGIKQLTATPVAVLTNGSLLWKPEVRKALIEADLVVPSLDAPSDDVFQRINRPHPGLSFEKIMTGLELFRQEYRGRIFLEILLVAGVNSYPDQVEKLAECARRINPDKVQLNTVVRPPVEKNVSAVSREDMIRLAGIFDGAAEVIAGYTGVPAGDMGITAEHVLELLRRRPCTVDDLISGLKAHPNEVLKYVAILMNEGRIVSGRQDGHEYFQVAI